MNLLLKILWLDVLLFWFTNVLCLQETEQHKHRQKLERAFHIKYLHHSCLTLLSWSLYTFASCVSNNAFSSLILAYINISDTAATCLHCYIRNIKLPFKVNYSANELMGTIQFIKKYYTSNSILQWKNIICTTWQCDFLRYFTQIHDFAIPWDIIVSHAWRVDTTLWNNMAFASCSL
jgi:hypothetical protein